MPSLVVPANAPQAVSDFSPQMVGRNCTLETNYKKVSPIKPFSITGEFIAFTSPDSTYAATAKLINNAKKEIIIGIYDFTAQYMKELLLNAMQRKVKVSLMLDIDSKDEQKIFDELEQFGCKSVPAPSCASKVINYFPSSHEKVIVIDGTWVIVQSGNYSSNSIPFNEMDGGDPKNFKKGNRDMGVAINSKPLADFFAKVLKKDMKLQLDAEAAQSVAEIFSDTPFLVEALPRQIPKKLFPSKSFNPSKKISVTPVLSPENYMSVVPDLLMNAKKSIYIENQYIRGTQPQVSKLLEAIKSAVDANPGLSVQIILGKLFDAKAVEKEKANIAHIKKTFGLALGKNIRFINTSLFVHCHNKLIIVDNKTVLISSQNWSDSAVSKNREAGVIIEYPELTKYYTGIFNYDWETAQKKIPTVGKPTIAQESVAKGTFIKVSPADYEEV